MSHGQKNENQMQSTHFAHSDKQFTAMVTNSNKRETFQNGANQTSSGRPGHTKNVMSSDIYGSSPSMVDQMPARGQAVSTRGNNQIGSKGNLQKIHKPPLNSFRNASNVMGKNVISNS